MPTELRVGSGPQMESDPCRPTAVSLFTGAGGLDIGLERAGFTIVAAVDNDADCIRTLETNQKARLPIPGTEEHHFLENTKIQFASIEHVTAKALRPPDGGRYWVPELLAGGPPCQPFSSAGKMLSVHDPRGRLFEHFVRIADEMQPRFILFENVRGLVTARGPRGEPGEALALVRSAFESIGYATSFALLNAADFGASQRRVRCFMLATRNSPLPQFPEPTHGECSSGSLFPGSPLPWITLQEFLTNQTEPSAREVVRPSASLAKQLAKVRDGSGLKSPGAREATRPGGHWGYKQGTFIADRSKPARTVTAASTQDWIRLKDGSLRRLTHIECAGLQGFSTEWRFEGNAASRFRQIGNAVPAIFGEVLGHSVISALARVRRRKAESAPFPAEFISAIAYTTREQRRNGPSRAAVLLSQASRNSSARRLKGLGSEETQSSARRAP